MDISKEYCEYGKKRIEETKESIGDIESAKYDIKPPKVSLEDMMQKNIIKEDERFFIKNDSNYVLIQRNGKVKLLNGEILDIHSAAAILLGKKAKRVNGFDYWYVKRDNHNIPIRDLREQYRKCYCVYEASRRKKTQQTVF